MEKKYFTETCNKTANNHLIEIFKIIKQRFLGKKIPNAINEYNYVIN